MKKLFIVILVVGLLLLSGCDGRDTLSSPELSSLIVPEPSLANVKYVPEGHFRQGLDVYLPTEGEGPFPTIFALHGGGFRARSKSLYGPMAGFFTNEGVALVAANYRLTPEFSYPAQIEDAYCALSWVFANAEELGFDRENIFVMGDSAGGYLAAMLGTVDSPNIFGGDCPHTLIDPDAIRGVVIFYGFYDLTSLDGHKEEDIRGALQPFMGAAHSQIPLEKLNEMSPKSWIDGSEPPFLIIHGSEDQTVQTWLSQEFSADLEEAGVKVELVMPEADHAFILQPLSSPTMVQSLDSIDSFLGGLIEP